MIKRILLVMMVLFAMTFVSAQTIPDAVDLDVTLVNQEPDPADPGSYVDVRFKIENSGSKNAEDVEFEVLPEYPFSLSPGEAAVESISTIGGRQTGDDGVIVKYRLRIAVDAVQGDNELEVRYRVDRGSWVKLPAFDISVRSAVAIVDIASVTSDPETIVPGEPSTITFTLENIEEGLLKDVTVALNLTDSAIPLAPLGSTAEKKVKYIQGGESASISIDVIALSNADAGIYKVPITLSYLDSSGATFSREGIVGLTVGSEPDLVVLVENSEVKKAGSSGKVDVKFTNKGLSDIKLLNVKLAETEQVDIISPSEVYIGNVDSDDYETIDFEVYVSDSDDGKVMLPFELEYRDANNKLFRETRNVELKIFSSSEAKKLGINGGNSAGPIVTVAIVVIGLVIYFLRKKKKKK